MIDIKDTLGVDLDAMNMKKKSSKINYLFFKTRCRSRSYTQIEELQDTEGPMIPEIVEENFIGYGCLGQKFEFCPREITILTKYEDTKKLFEEALSPTVVTLSKMIENEMVSYSL